MFSFNRKGRKINPGNTRNSFTDNTNIWFRALWSHIKMTHDPMRLASPELRRNWVIFPKFNPASNFIGTKIYWYLEHVPINMICVALNNGYWTIGRNNLIYPIFDTEYFVPKVRYLRFILYIFCFSWHKMSSDSPVGSDPVCQA